MTLVRRKGIISKSKYDQPALQGITIFNINYRLTTLRLAPGINNTGFQHEKSGCNFQNTNQLKHQVSLRCQTPISYNLYPTTYNL